MIPKIITSWGTNMLLFTITLLIILCKIFYRMSMVFSLIWSEVDILKRQICYPRRRKFIPRRNKKIRVVSLKINVALLALTQRKKSYKLTQNWIFHHKENAIKMNQQSTPFYLFLQRASLFLFRTDGTTKNWRRGTELN